MKNNKNFLENIPCHNTCITWLQDQDGLVTLKIKNRGLANFMAQKLLKKPTLSYVHLDEFGSFIWTHIDGKSNLINIGKQLKERFGDKAEPVYERMTQYVQTLKTNKFITIN